MLGQVCGWLIVAWLAATFFGAVHCDFNGRPKREPLGFPGFIGSCVVMSLLAVVYWKAGAFDKLW